LSESQNYSEWGIPFQRGVLKGIFLIEELKDSSSVILIYMFTIPDGNKNAGIEVILDQLTCFIRIIFNIHDVDI